jgi:hypothetical protein
VATPNIGSLTLNELTTIQRTFTKVFKENITLEDTVTLLGGKESETKATKPKSTIKPKAKRKFKRKPNTTYIRWSNYINWDELVNGEVHYVSIAAIPGATDKNFTKQCWNHGYRVGKRLEITQLGTAYKIQYVERNTASVS